MKSKRITFQQGILKGLGHGVGLGLGLIATGLAAVTISGAFHTFSSGELLNASKMNENFSSLKTAIEGVPDCTRYFVRLTLNGGHSVSNAVYTPMTSYTEDSDTQNMHTDSLPSRITIPVAGRYLIIGGVTFSAKTEAGGTRSAMIYKNGTQAAENSSPGVAAVGHTVEVSTVMDLTVNDFLELYAHQWSNGIPESATVYARQFTVQRLCDKIP